MSSSASGPSARAATRALQRLLFERLDEDLRWLESLGAPVLARDTGNDLTTGVRFDTEGLTAALTEAAGEVRLSSALSEPEASAPTVLATGGFAREPRPAARARDARGRPRAAARGPRIDRGRAAHGPRRGRLAERRLDEVYARAMPAPPARVTPPSSSRSRSSTRATRRS